MLVGCCGGVLNNAQSHLHKPPGCLSAGWQQERQEEWSVDCSVHGL